MVTYQDLKEVIDKNDQKLLTQFVYSTIMTHKSSDDYKLAVIAQDYHARKNTTIMQYRKLLYTVAGEAVPDNYSANHKLCSNFFFRFTTQENQYLLANGVNWNEDSTDEMLGEDFDTRLQELGLQALIEGVSFGFWNYDHLEVFKLSEYVPIYDEENGALMAGIRFWQIDASKPLRATLYEIDGYTDYIWNRKTDDGKVQGDILHEKRPYILKIRATEADGEEIYDGENYPSFPFIPLWANSHKQSELTGLREDIDAYDLIRSGFANDLDDVSQIYWIIQNAGGMDDIDLAKFLDRLRTVKAAVVEEDGARAESHTVDVPYASREALLTRLRNDMYEDAMALDVSTIAGGAVTATQIRAAYEPLNSKTDMYESQIRDFLKHLLTLIGVNDSPSFSRSTLVNAQEEVNVIMNAADYLSERYITEKVLTLLGDIDQVEDVMNEKNEADMERFDAESEDEELGLEDEESEDDMFADIESQVFDEEESEDDEDINSIIEELRSLVGGM